MRRDFKTSLIFLVLLGLTAAMTAYGTLAYAQRAVEYRVDIVAFQHDPPNGLQEHLNAMSKDGWRLVQFVEHDEWYRVVMSRTKR